MIGDPPRDSWAHRLEDVRQLLRECSGIPTTLAGTEPNARPSLRCDPFACERRLAVAGRRHEKEKRRLRLVEKSSEPRSPNDVAAGAGELRDRLCHGAPSFGGRRPRASSVTLEAEKVERPHLRD